MTQIRQLLITGILLLTVFSIQMNAQVTGDYGSANTVSTWSTITDWLVCKTNGTWVGADTASVIPTETNTVWIRDGHTVTITGYGKCKDLIIESNGKLLSSSNKYNPKNLRIYGSTATINGSFSEPDNGIVVQCYGGSSQVVTFNGSTTVYLSRIYPNNSSGAVVFNTDVVLNYPGLTGTGSTGLLSSNNNDVTCTVNAGKTLTLENNTYIAPNGTSATAAGNGNLTLNINGTLNASGANSCINLNTAAGKTVTLNIGSSGVVNTSAPIRANYINKGTTNINIAQGGKLNALSGSNLQFSKSNLSIDGELNSQNAVDDSIGATTINTNGSLKLTKTAGNLRIGNALQVTGTLDLGNNKLVLGSNNVKIGSNGKIERGSGFVVTNGTGSLTMNGAAGTTILFPVGASSVSYDPVSVIPQSVSEITVKVGTALSGQAGSEYVLNQKEWNVSSSSASATQISFTPSDVLAIGNNPVIGQFDGANYNYFKAVLDGSTYSGTFDSFTAFVTGATDKIFTKTKFNRDSGLSISKSNGTITLNGTCAGQKIRVYKLDGQMIHSLTANANKVSLNLAKGLYMFKVDNEVIKFAF